MSLAASPRMPPHHIPPHDSPPHDSPPHDSPRHEPPLHDPPPHDSPAHDTRAPNGASPQDLSYQALVLAAVVTRPAAYGPPPRKSLLSVCHLVAPHLPRDHPTVASARDALVSSPEFVFPHDLPQPPELGDDEDEDAATEVGTDEGDGLHPLDRHQSGPAQDEFTDSLFVPVHATVPSSAPPPLRLPSASSAFPTSPISDSPPASPGAISPHVQLDRAVDMARTLPLNSDGVFSALSDPSREPGSRMLPRSRSTKAHTGSQKTVLAPPRFSEEEVRPHRASSLPRRPSSSPPSRVRSLGVPAYTREITSLPVHQQRHHSAHSNRSPEMRELSLARRRRNFRHVLLCSKTHVFATTARDGSRHYVYCRPLSTMHALVLLSTVSHTAVYVSALERTAARYALLIDEIQGARPLSKSNTQADGLNRTGSPSPAALTFAQRRTANFLRFEIFRCPPQIARELARTLLDWLSGCAPSADQKSLAGDGMFKRTRSRILREYADQDVDTGWFTDGDTNSATCLTSSTASSGLSSGARNTSRRQYQFVLQETSPRERGFGPSFRKRDGELRTDSTSSSTQNGSTLPWEVAASNAGSDAASVRRVLELTDATLLFRHFPIRGILSVLVALLEERRVCVVGPHTAVVSRAVVAFDNLLRPFEWPHLVSPILVEHLLPVLGAPFPFLVGILSSHFEQTKDIPLDQVIFAHLDSGKVTDNAGQEDMFKRIPRRIRLRLEKRLTRTRHACIRQVNRSMSSPFVPTVSNTATSYFRASDELLRPEKARPSLFRSKSSLRLADEAKAQNIWLAHGTVLGLDKCMRKFFLDLLDDLKANCGDEDVAHLGVKSEGLFRSQTSAATSVTLVPARRDPEKGHLVKAFCKTQMFMQWSTNPLVDPSFGIVSSDSSLLKMRSSTRGSNISSRTASHMGNPNEGNNTNTAEIEASDPECDESFMEDRHLPAFFRDAAKEKKRLLRKSRSRRDRARLQFSLEVRDNEEDSRAMCSDVESAAPPFKDMASVRPRNLSTECIAESQSNFQSRMTWLKLRLPSNRWTVSKDYGLGSSGKEDFTAEYIFDRLEAECTEAEESDDEFDSSPETEGHFYPLSANGKGHALAIGKGRVAAWGRRRGRQPSHV